MKLNLGPGNNFIVKNSNILITSNPVNKGTINTSIHNNNDDGLNNNNTFQSTGSY
jgi:hypothetical protein